MDRALRDCKAIKERREAAIDTPEEAPRFFLFCLGLWVSRSKGGGGGKRVRSVVFAPDVGGKRVNSLVHMYIEARRCCTT